MKSGWGSASLEFTVMRTRTRKFSFRKGEYPMSV
jgi:hypothetical protein